MPALGLLLSLGSCSKDDSNTVVLYSSMDEGAIRPILAEFEKRAGMKVLLVGDTEATKTTGLVTRVMVEKDRPKADVWWSSEALGTMKLSNAGLFAPYTSKGNEADFAGGWPAELRGLDHDWYGLAPRPRVFAYHTGRVAAGDVPRTLADLTQGKFKGRVGMARPEFGTTRGHIDALRLVAGDAAVSAWLDAMKANDLRLYDGNSAVVRAIAHGEIDVGITDRDDVNAGKANGWPVAAAFETRGDVTKAGASPMGLLAVGTGTFMTPSTVAILRGARHVLAATMLVDFILSADTERMLAGSDWASVPVRPAVAREFPALAVPEPLMVDWESVVDSASGR